jgi:hypothetical protein
MTVEAIKEAIQQLSESERHQLAGWFEELEDQVWDSQIEKDFSRGGRGAFLLEEIKAEIESGTTKPLDEFLAEAEANREAQSTTRS